MSNPDEEQLPAAPNDGGTTPDKAPTQVGRRRLLAGIGAVGGLSLASVAAACSSGPSAAATSADRAAIYPKFDKQWFIYFATHGIVHPFWSTLQKGAEEGAKAMNLRYKWTQDTVFSVQTTIARMDAAIAEKPDFLVFSCPDPTAMRTQFQKAKDAGIPTVCINSGDPAYPAANSVPYDCYIGGNEFGGGAACAQACLEPWGSLPAQPKRGAVLASTPGNITTSQRNAGWESVFKPLGIPTQVYDISGGTTSGGGNPTNVFTATKAMLTQQPDIDAMFVVSGGPDMVAVQQVLTELNLTGKIKLVQIDLTGGIVKDITDNKATAVVDFGPYLEGYLPSVLARTYLDWGVMPTNQQLFTGPNIVNSKNAAQALDGANAGYR